MEILDLFHYVPAKGQEDAGEADYVLCNNILLKDTEEMPSC